MSILFLIPARGGSKGIPGKNSKILGDKPLIHYSIEVARQFTDDAHICISTDDAEIIRTVEETGLQVPFIRPSELATDSAGTYEVLLHAIKHYESIGEMYDTIILLQPTSPFRKVEHIKEALELYSEKIDMVVSVTETKSNPYYTLVEENINGFLEKSKKASFTRRQDCPKVYEYNGSIYVMNVNSLKSQHINQFAKVKKYVMDSRWSVDLDTPQDWLYAEFLINQKLF